ncbi:MULTISPECIES: metal ABC transporter substrate-binding protein [Pasteurellaceae]|uniref:Metal ABC transporter substrate-binding protein n=1 Tax=Pasteurella atlantica TaxID=2827233 RepID=A0AAW8CER8_9PAST|nr:metal ABC transporter substrate-binding protein [Pasteurella atlantica]MBR0574451.1 metal ABC transporter substrate-binding protein [Pasteurella atlantica]MDP8039328.1 metal ABC transporter substrate-binding protein [Pasteurella atlantica]MDP8041420.1 metal ABC transporter substrate-binding protein [Pasteurella atlantica]MDP8043655.1 metal ABC transporter substrate-binding protein [Pasteurella atlantica]MDP8045641.1 metal ABC transporter substrate-binding protein [Pasteurella atlantica]
MKTNKLLLTSLLIGGLFSPLAQAHNHTKFKVATTFTVIQDIAQNVAGDAADVVSITVPGAEIHEYETTPDDLKRVHGSDLILFNGMNLELWFKKFYRDYKDIPSVEVTKGIVPMPILEGSYEGKPNPHAWMSPTNAEIYVNNIRDAFIKYDPENAETYKVNAKKYIQQIRDLDAPLRAKLSKVPTEQRWLVTAEGAFSYLTRDYGFKEAYIWPINADEMGSPKQVSSLINQVRANKIPVVFSESTNNDQGASAKQVAKEAGAKYGGVLYVDSLSAKDGPTPTYLDLLKVTVSTIAKGFEK